MPSDLVWFHAAEQCQALSVAGCCKCARSGLPLVPHMAPSPPHPTPSHPPSQQIGSAAELQQCLEAHPGRLVVAHFSADGCPFGAAFAPWLAQAARRFPAALFLNVASAAEPAAPAAPAEQLLPATALDVGPLPCMLLLQDGRVVQRLELIGSSLAGSLDASADGSFDATDAAAAETWQPAVEAAAAARLLHAALLGALVRVRLLHADCAPLPAVVYA